MEHPFVVFTDHPWVWGPLYGTCLVVGGVLIALNHPFGPLLVVGVVGSFLAISFWSVLLWVIERRGLVRWLR